MPNTVSVLKSRPANTSAVAAAELATDLLSTYRQSASSLRSALQSNDSTAAAAVYDAFRQFVRDVRALERSDATVQQALLSPTKRLLNDEQHGVFLSAMDDVEVGREFGCASSVLDGTVDRTRMWNANHHYEATLQPEIQLTLAALADSPNGRSVLIGAGPLPVTSVLMSRHLDPRRCVAIDRDPVCAAIGESVLRAVELPVAYHVAAGQSFEFRQDDVPLLAVMVADRVDVLRSLHQQGVKNVIVRNVAGVARLCYSGTALADLESTGYRVAGVLSESDKVLRTALHLERVA
jgi:hypothetical protein